MPNLSILASPAGIGAILGLVLLLGLFGKSKNTKNWGIGLIAFGLASVFILGTFVPMLNTPVNQLVSGATLAIGGAGVASDGASGGIATYQPTNEFTAKDIYATTTVTGTSYYKRGSNPATTTASTNAVYGQSVTYWVSNGTTPAYYWVTPKTLVTNSPTNTFVADAVLNGTGSVVLYDTLNSETTTNGVYNTSVGANGQANIQVKYTGTAKRSAIPFGGVMVVEYNTTFSSLTCTGNDIVEGLTVNGQTFHVTYTSTALGTTNKMFGVAPTLDDGTGAQKSIFCQFQNGATDVEAGAPYYFKFLPANYYVTQNGDITLDTEKNADSATTRTGTTISQPSATGYFS